MTDRVCKAVGLPCSFPEYYEAAAAGESTDRVCKAVSAECDDGCDEIKAPSKSSDRVCKKFYETCKDVIIQDPDAKSGVYEMRPASLNGDAFKVYCLNNVNIAKGGWTLIGKAGVGDWSRLSDDAYFDLILNKDKDVSPDDLLTPDRPIAGRTMAFYNEKKTNALGASTIAASQNPVFLIQMGREWFAQVRIKPDKSWSFWRAIRDQTYWSSDAETFDYINARQINVNNYGIDFRITKDLDSINFNTGLFRMNTCDDYSVGYWGAEVINGAFTSKHGGLLGDGYCNGADQWMWTSDRSDGRFKNDGPSKQVMIYIR